MKRLFINVGIGLTLRALSLGGKVAFILVASIKMPATEFGTFGIFAAMLVLGQVAIGGELHQVMLRRLIQGSGRRSFLSQRMMFVYALVAGLFLALFFGILAVAQGHVWSITLLICTLAFLEYLNLEFARILLALGRGKQALLQNFIRSSAWGLTLIAVSAAGLIGQWSFELALYWWLAGSVAALICAFPVWRLRYRLAEALRHLSRVFRTAFGKSWIFLLGSSGLLFLDQGGRILAGFLLSKTAAGEFYLLATFASLSYIVVFGTVPYLFHADIVGHDRQRHWTGFVVITAVLTAASAIAGYIAALLYSAYSDGGYGTIDYTGLGLLILGYAAFSLSVIPKYHLYHRHLDRRMNIVWFAHAVAFAVLCTLLAPNLGVRGLCLALAISASSLFLVLLLLCSGGPQSAAKGAEL